MQAFLSLAFGIEAFLMSSHKKHQVLDETVHWLLALTMWACAVSILLEMVWKHSVLPSAARSLSCIMQGIWLIQVISASACRHLLMLKCPSATSLWCKRHISVMHARIAQNQSQ